MIFRSQYGGSWAQFELGNFDVVSLSFFPTFSTSKFVSHLLALTQAYAKKKITFGRVAWRLLGGDHIPAMPLTDGFVSQGLS